MQRISVHISDKTKHKIDLAVKANKNKIEAELIREALDVGLDIIFPKSCSTQALLDLAVKAEQLPSKVNTHRDVSENLDFYAWGGEKKSES